MEVTLPTASLSEARRAVNLMLSAQRQESWREIDPALIEDGHGAVPSFPLDLLPAVWREWVGQTARSAGAPVDYVAQSLLAAVAALCGAGALVRVTAAWMEPLVLWQILVGRASSGKSPALASVRSLLDTLECDLSLGRGKDDPRIVVSDPTLATLARAVAAYPRGPLLWRDEPSAWFADFAAGGAWRAVAGRVDGRPDSPSGGAGA